MTMQFSDNIEGCEVRYTGQSYPKYHVKSCEEAWSNIPQEQWVHKFINTLDTTPINWYLQVELHLTTVDWYGMTQKFVDTFLFESQYPIVDQALQVVRHKVFEEAPSLPLEHEEDEWTAPLQKLQGCYNINANEDDDPRKVNITEIEGQRDIEGPGIELPFIGQSINIKKVNIGTKKAPKLVNVGDYWDDATIDKIIELLHEYHDLFPAKFTDMKGIKGPMGEMKFPLKTNARLVKQRPYRLNPKYKEKLKIELDRMLEAGIIEPIEESEWIGPMVLQDKKIGEIRIYVDLKKLNDAYLHDPFPTPFNDEVLDNVGG
jgi:hypothetical protein